MDKTILLHLKDGNRLFKVSELIEEAKRQELDGVKPHYSYYNYKKAEKVTPLGWLVYSTFADGCGVVYKMSDTSDKYILVTGWQGDFCFD